MGLFDSLFGSGSRSKAQVLDDKVWLTQKAKFNGLTQEINEHNDAAAILLIAHFDDTLAQLNEMAADYQGHAALKATLAEQLPEDLAATLNVDESATIDLIVAERHPLPSADNAIQSFAEQIPCKCRLAYHLSLEDPIMKLFVTKFIQKLLEGLGMKEDEAIDSEMVGRRVKAAQKKIEAAATGNSRAASATEWLEINAPTLCPERSQ